MITGEYIKFYKDSIYYPLWQHVLKYVRRISEPKILEVGCGSGQLAHFLYDEGFKDYKGFDINPEMVGLARKNSPQDFFVGDALNKINFVSEYNTVIATEVLEHIQNDFGIIKNIKSGTNFILSVPSFKCDGHLRWFSSAPEIINYYFDYLNIKELVRMRKLNSWFIGWGITK